MPSGPWATIRTVRLLVSVYLLGTVCGLVLSAYASVLRL
jgi:hypothetical protein